MRLSSSILAVVAGLLLSFAGAASAADSGVETAQPAPARFGWFSGDWALTIGASGDLAPDYEGDDSFEFKIIPLISVGKVGPEARFVSRNDGISFPLIDEGRFRVGPVGKIVFGRDSDDSDDLDGLNDVKFGGELGAFAEYYPTDWLRVRGELRHGIRSHHGLIGDVFVDGFYDVTDVIRVSAGPRVSFANQDYFDAYYGVDAAESAASGLPVYSPKSGVHSVGVGGAVDWKITPAASTSLFAEYERLGSPAADSSLVQLRGSENQFTVGVTARYRFGFVIP